MTTEPFGTAALLATFGALLAIAAIFSRASQRIAVPLALAFLGVGMLAGSQGLGGIPFDDYAFAFRLGTIALVLILFDGGLNTPLGTLRDAIAPSGVLATLGVVGTAGLVAWAAHSLGFAWPHAMLLGAIVSSTDAAAVFSVLRGSGIQLKRRVGVTLEVESGINDPMAVILTIATTRHLLSPATPLGWRLALDVLWEIAVGLAFGAGIGWGARLLISRVRLPAGGLYPALTLGVAFLAFSVPTLLHGSGFLAVYVAAAILGDGRLPYRLSLLRVHDALGWLSQITMFLVLGLLVFPSRVLAVAGTGLALALFLAFIARPLVTALCLLPFRAYTRRDVAYVGWVGLRGAVPIILATYPVLSGAPGARRVFDVVFFVVVVNALLPGATVPWVTRRLGLESTEPPPPPAVLEIESMQPLVGELVSFHIDETLAPCGSTLRELPFPGGASVVLIVRGRELVAPNGDTVLQPGDHAYVVTSEEDKPLLHLLFGRTEQG
ncbi:sodium/hydrogen exchanger (plasmid) [Gemmatirosa kalamazoonensis]|uniref:Sodium/hydrogen exchanger n=1 Tax=Gemmatirosa kalamazoonensis TaxID=861299 RepID=W0RMP2_9BACT|nr:potassium/proton antiporter [Gemmatirosa kalamazoonensis]AHG92314.1 sodium/hydrogen exchanger [Gemmatirosa kalamazoonensis]